jgi:hypothetical protein
MHLSISSQCKVECCLESEQKPHIKRKKHNLKTISADTREELAKPGWCPPSFYG